MRLTETNESISFKAEIGLAVGTLHSWCGSVGVAIGSGVIGVFSGSGFVRTR
ncbi:hypothetical protein [Microcoleus sp. B7-D4]|uniref:hypothetical protein n=1 Tax=Microcoleus sp. B7-D4 TaxID=2818696 RepID=UPI002FD45684